MTDSANIFWLVDWFARHCDGDWEHGDGITIETLDNPGWMVKVNLADTELAGVAFPELDERFRSDDDWVTCRVREGVFEGFGGVKNLDEILGAFRSWAATSATA